MTDRSSGVAGWLSECGDHRLPSVDESCSKSGTSEIGGDGRALFMSKAEATEETDVAGDEFCERMRSTWWR